MAEDFDRMFSVEKVMELTDLSRSVLYKYMRDGTFPKPAVQAGRRAPRWLLSQLKAWQAERTAGVGDGKK